MPTYNPSLPAGYLTGDSGQIVLAKDDAEYQAARLAFQQASGDGKDVAYAIIDADPNMTPEMKALAKATVEAYSGGVEADAPSILRTFDQLKQTTIDPHFNDLIKQAEYGLNQNVAALEASRKTELEAQGTNATEAVRTAQNSLEGSGLLNSGEAVRQLGSEGAPAIPFGGADTIEGLVPQRNRLIATDTQSRYQEGLRSKYNTAEQALGTAGVAGMVPQGQQIGGVTGTIPTQRTTQYGQTLTSLAANEQAKRDLTKQRANPVAPIATNAQ
jgi:hypothetical protein